MQHILAIISYKMTHALKCTVDLLKNDMDIVNTLMPKVI